MYVDSKAHGYFFAVNPVIKFEVNPSPEQVATAEAQGIPTIPTQAGVVIISESDGTEPNEKPKAKNRRKEEPEVQVVNGPTVRFPEYLK